MATDLYSNLLNFAKKIIQSHRTKELNIYVAVCVCVCVRVCVSVCVKNNFW